MHASLASIGRACTVEDEEPPETPSQGSIDSQQEYGIVDPSPHYPTRPNLTVRELVQRTSNLTRQTRIVPYFDKVLPMKCLAQVEDIQPENTTSENPALLSSPVDIESRLNRLSHLHRLCELVRKTIWLDSMTGVCNELHSGWVNLARHSDRITSKEYGNLDACNSAFTHVPASPCPDKTANQGAVSNRYGKLNHSGTLAFRPSVSLNSSQLGELRVLSESLRQSLTQTKHYAHEQHTLFAHWEVAAGGHLSPFVTSLANPLQVLNVCTTQLTSITLQSAHHLIYSGLSLLAHSDLTRFTHGDLWEMLRGMEELDILSKTIQSNQRLTHAANLRPFLTRTLFQTLNSQQLLRTDLFSHTPSPLPSIAVGYLFVLLANQRALRLADAVFRQLCTICSCDRPSSTSGASSINHQETGKSSRPNLVETFRNYLRENYGRSSSEYLRTEYEFISGFLDVLSQSTNLLYQVEKLKLVCSAAAAAQARKAELVRDWYPVVSKPGTIGAMSVEGKHGILISRGSGETMHMKYQHQEKNPHSNHYGPKRASKSLGAQYQETLHRSGTLDRYVATGSTVYPLSEDTAANTDKALSTRVRENPSAEISPTTSPMKTSTEDRTNSRKSVQWSDHREISTRHQVIGRFLEMVWQYSEQRLNSMFLVTPEFLVTSYQSWGLSHGTVQPDSQGYWPLSGCLHVSPSKLHRLASDIHEVAKTDIFPAGLVPVLRRQALKLDELAHRRCYYSELLRLKMNTTTEHFPMRSTIASQQPNGDFITYSTQTHTAPCQPGDSSEFAVLDTIECVTSTLNKLHPEGSNSQWENSILPVCSPTVQVAFTSTVQLLLKCSQQFSGPRSNGSEEQFNRIINMQLSSLGFHTQAETPSKPIGLQSSERIQSAYNLCRRIQSVALRLTQLLSLTLKHTTSEYLCVASNYIQPEGCSINTLHPLCRATIKQSAIINFLLVLCTLVYRLVKHIETKLYTYCEPPEQRNTSVGGNCNQAVRVHPVGSINPQNLSHLRLGLPNGVRFYSVLRCLRTIARSMSHLSCQIKHAQLRIDSCFRLCCDTLLRHDCSTPPSNKLDFGVASSERVTRFVDCLNDVAPLLICVHENSNCSGQPAAGVCPFHAQLYSSNCGMMFDHFCQHWLQDIQYQLQQLNDSNSRFIRLKQTTMAIRQLITSLFTQQSALPVHLRTILGGCDSFRQLQASTLNPYEELHCCGSSNPSGCEQFTNSSYHNVKGQLSSTSTSDAVTLVAPAIVEENPNGAKASTSNTNTSSLSALAFPRPTAKKLRIKFANRCNAHGEAIASLAAGVRSSFMVSLKSFASGATGDSTLTPSSPPNPSPNKSPNCSPDHQIDHFTNATP